MLEQVLDLSKSNLADFLYFAADFVAGKSIGIQIISQFVFLSILLVPLPRLMRTICPLFAPQILNIQCFHLKYISLMDPTLPSITDVFRQNFQPSIEFLGITHRAMELVAF